MTRTRTCYALIFMLLTLFLSGCATHQMDHGSMDHSSMDHSQMQHMGDHSKPDAGAVDHSVHQAMMQRQDYQRSIESYQIPDLLLTDQQGQDVSLAELLQTDKPVIVNFLYATCTTICPLLSMGYIDLQRELAADTEKVLLVSITIDPEHDTPEVLEAYRRKFGGKPGWTLVTGTRIDIDNVMTAFDAFFGDKMDHQPLNFIRLPEPGNWLRLNGMIGGKDFLHEMKMAGIDF